MLRACLLLPIVRKHATLWTSATPDKEPVPAMGEEKNAARDSREQLRSLKQLLPIALPEWPSLENEGWEAVRAVWQFCREQLSGQSREGWHLIKDHERALADLVELADEHLERERKREREDEALLEHILKARNRYAANLSTLRLFERQYLATYSIPPELSQEEAEEIAGGMIGWDYSNHFKSKTAWQHFQVAYWMSKSDEKFVGKSGRESASSFLETVAEKNGVEFSTVRESAEENDWYGHSIREDIQSKAEEAGIPEGILKQITEEEPVFG